VPPDHPRAVAGAAGDDVSQLAAALATIGRRVRDAVRGVAAADDHEVVRTEGGDDIYGIDARAEEALATGLTELSRRWPGRAVVEGHDDEIVVGHREGPWVYLVDPVDGTRPLLAGKRSAWVLLGAGRGARTLEDLEVGAMVEIPTSRQALGRVAWAVRGGRPEAYDDDLVGGGPPVPVELCPRRDARIDHSFVTVVRLLPGDHERIGRWADRHLRGLRVWDDLVPCTGGYLAGLADGSDTAVLDPRPLLSPSTLAAHPYDLASLVVARAAGAVIEALPPGPLAVPIDTVTPVAWAGYANEDVAARLRPTAPIS
jgi:hypothetical protein